MSRPRVVVPVVAAVALVLAVLLLGPGLTRERVPIASTGAPAPLATAETIKVPAGGRLCAENVLLSPRTEVVQLLLAKLPVPDLSFVLEGDGFRSAPTRMPADAVQGNVLTAPVAAPDRELVGRVCLINDGRRSTQLIGTTEPRTMSRLQTTLDGEPVAPDLTLTLLEDRRTSVLGALPQVVDHVAGLRGFLGTAWLLWPLLVLVVAGVPAALFFALFRGLTAAEDAGRS